MSRCVPNGESDEQPNFSYGLQLDPSSSATTLDAAAAVDPFVTGLKMDCEVAELMWVDGHPSTHGLGHFRMDKPLPKHPSSPASWEKVLAGGGTLEAVVDQATGASPFPSTPSPATTAGYGLVPFFRPSERRGCSSTATAVPVDALVPSFNQPQARADGHSTGAPEPPAGVSGVGRKRGRDGNCSVSGSAACENIDVVEDVAFTTSTCPLDASLDTEYTSSGRPVTALDEHESASQTLCSLKDEGCVADEKKAGGEANRPSSSTKRSRAAAVHNQSERKRRDRINQRMKTLQKLVPNSNKMDKASMLDEVIEYLKKLQSQVQKMNMLGNIPHMMVSMPMQHLHMTMMAQMTQMAQMGMGMGMTMGMDVNPLIRSAAQSTALRPPPMLQPPAFFPFVGPSWDASGERVQRPVGSMGLPTDPFSAFIAQEAQKAPMNLDAFHKMAAVHQQAFQPPPGPSNTDPKRNPGR